MGAAPHTQSRHVSVLAAGLRVRVDSWGGWRTAGVLGEFGAAGEDWNTERSFLSARDESSEEKLGRKRRPACVPRVQKER